ncbi:cyclic pyranopterin monophosphate synthase MoaC [Candidatus Bathyarchaeota archaeon]|nr:cyclic pyranopterin monophosphate synthase MoaC [Candidatus Bathyarchaeota archaeon]
MNEKDPYKMVDIGEKEIIFRTAQAIGFIKLSKDTIKAILNEKISKGDPLAVAEIACIQAVKKTSDLIPMCHNLQISKINADFILLENGVEARCQVNSYSKTGVEMEALTGVTVALLTIWDMVKYLEKDLAGQYPDTVITDIRILEKKKG